MAFVVFFLALADGDGEFDVAGAAIEADGDDGGTVDLGAFKFANLLLGSEELDVSGGIGAKREIIEP